MRILLFGKGGQLGWELQRALAPLGHVIALGTHDTPCADFRNPSQVGETVRKLAPDVIVNAAAYTAVDNAEGDADTAMIVNGVAPGVLAQAAHDLGAWLIHYSTDYVFNGSGARPWREDDTAAPLNVYGHSKLAGETNIMATGCRHLIFRTSWVYAARGQNFARTMLRLGQERETLNVVADQIGAPTGADLIADITAHALRSVRTQPDIQGVFHLAAAGETSWHGYAAHVLQWARHAGLPVRVAETAIEPVPSAAFASPAARPANSRLDTSRLRSTFGLHLPDWKAGVDRMLAEIHFATTS